MITAIEPKDANGSILQRLDRGESCESAAYDHDPRSADSRGRCCLCTHRAVSSVRLPGLPCRHHRVPKYDVLKLSYARHPSVSTVATFLVVDSRTPAR